MIRKFVHIRYSKTSSWGMWLQAASAYRADKNCVYLDSAAVSGINMDACTNDTLSNNTIKGASGNATSNYCAVSSGDCTNYTYQCNSVDSTYKGFYFGGTNSGAGTFQTNHFNHHYYGLYVDSSGIMGSQFHQGNLWNVPFRKPSLGAWVQNLRDIFTYHLPAGLKVPATPTVGYTPYIPSDLFQSDPSVSDSTCTDSSCH